MRPSPICLETHTIQISSIVSKIREPRKVTLHPNLAAWLRAYPLDRYPIVVGNFKRRREQFRDKLQLTHDVLRHTFISMFVAKYRSFGEAGIQTGNSESDLKRPQEAEEFFSIVPKNGHTTETEAVPLGKDGS